MSDLKCKFMAKVERTDSCWLWRGSIPKSGDGYGWFSLGHRSERAHRVAYQLFVGPVPTGMLVCHRCDNRICVNPKHLFVGTVDDNNKDRTRKGRTVAPHGERHYNSHSGVQAITEERFA